MAVELKVSLKELCKQYAKTLNWEAPFPVAGGALPWTPESIWGARLILEEMLPDEVIERVKKEVEAEREKAERRSYQRAQKNYPWLSA